jgi:5-methyltetrahydrofolate--homocysteine methyltransferase
MIVVGELLNSSQQKIEEAFIKRDESLVVDLAVRQERAGCAYLDLNAATLMDKDEETVVWAISLLQTHTSVPISIDSPNARALAAGLRVHRGQALLNSLPGKKTEIKEIIPLIREFSSAVVVSCLGDR